MSRPRLGLAALVAVLLSLPLPAQTLSDLFQEAKAQVKRQSWQDALATLDRLDTESAAPGNEAARQQLAAPIAFYRGVCEANLDQTEKAEADFAAYRQARPDSTIDATMYSKKAVAAFHAAANDARPAPSGNEAESLRQRYETFQAPPSSDEKGNTQWANGPVKWLITPEETAAWAALTDDAARADFVEKFWEKRNPNPGAAENPARTEFDRRVAFADAYLKVDGQQRGSLTDPGMVFVLLGPPNRTGRKPILGEEDTNISDGTSVPGQWFMANRNSVHFDGFTLAEASGSFREIWYYKREALPRAVSTNALNVAFVTKIGYGRFVLQRDPATANALVAARAGSPETRVAGGTGAK